MISISLCMIVKDEEEVLSRCLDSIVPIIDEIIIVDTGSRDQTREIALKYTDRLLHYTWKDDFADARNFAFEAATQSYILWLDADDVITPAEQQKLLKLKQTLQPSIDVVSMIYELGRDDYGNTTHSLRRNRLVKRSLQFRWHGVVHEVLQVSGLIQESDIVISHQPLSDLEPGRNLRIYSLLEKQGKEFSPRDTLYYANELLDHQDYEAAAIRYEHFLNEGKGWIEDEVNACGKLADCYNALGDRTREWEAICRSFQYDNPRAEFCCRIGYRLLHEGKFEAASHWYRIAIELPPPSRQWGLVNHACLTWLPHLQLCVCYDRMGQHALANEHNEIARTYCPNDPVILQNKRYLESLLISNNNI